MCFRSSRSRKRACRSTLVASASACTVFAGRSSAEPNPFLRTNCFESVFVLAFPMSFSLLPSLLRVSLLRKARTQRFASRAQRRPRYTFRQTPCSHALTKPSPRNSFLLMLMQNTRGWGYLPFILSLFFVILCKERNLISSFFNRLRTLCQKQPGCTSLPKWNSPSPASVAQRLSQCSASSLATCLPRASFARGHFPMSDSQHKLFRSLLHEAV